MKLTFDYYHNLEQVELRLCNPDGRELFPLPGKSRNLTLRFNDLSELTFEVDSTVTLSDGNVVNLEAYDYIQTKRLVYATNIGWFQISSVDEQDNGVVKYKSVTAESYQAVLKNKGFLSEERVYCFYNPDDPYDDRYDSFSEDAIPSVLGQLNKQLGINQALEQGLEEPLSPYEDWTVTYINPSLIYSGTNKLCRTFKENTTYGYDWIVNDVEDAFEVIILFDFMYKSIHVMLPSEITQKANVIYTFSNFMKNINVTENADDIVTVLNCSGDNCDITAVNPTGTNYVCDFSYYMDETHHRWMSSALIAKLKQWQSHCETQKAPYEECVSNLRGLYQSATEKETLLQEMSLVLADLRTAQNKRTVLGSGTPGALCGIVSAEIVKTSRKVISGVETVVGGKSIKPGSDYHNTAFTGAQRITAYEFAPKYDTTSRKWVWTDAGKTKTGTADEIVAYNLSDSNTFGTSYWYFSDVNDGSSYCKLESAVTVDKETTTSTYYCGGFNRYIAYVYPIINSNGSAEYVDHIQEWIDLRETHVNELNISLCGYALQLNGYQMDEAGEVITPTPDSIYGQIKALEARVKEIADSANIISYFSSTPGLLRELNCYWIEGDYTNEHISVLEETTPAEAVDLANELLAAGRVELSKVCQPRYSFSIESIDATKNYEFREQMGELELGKIITIEKEEGLWYYPALLEIAISLDNSDEFTMTFANAMRLDDWGYTYADLISDASSTSRQVSANWQNILAYAKEREEISSLIKDPLDTTLRAAFANMTNQEFTIDKTGILGRKKVSETSDEFESEQVRLINNVLIFTDDNWETAKTALGKLYYTDALGNQVTSYGLIAETIIGSLIMGERLKITNPGSTIGIGADGITITQTDGTVVFQAKPDGTLVVRNYASQSQVNQLSSDLNGLGTRMETAEASLTVQAGQIALKANQETVDTIVTDIGELVTRMETAEASLTVQAGQIALKASQETVDTIITDVGDLNTRMESAEASIQVQSGQISLKASKETVEALSTNVDDLSGYVNGLTTDISGLITKVSKAESSIEQQADKISAKVSQTYGSSSSSFGWKLQSTGFEIYSNKKTVFKATSSGLEVTGKISADEGYIAGWTIGYDSVLQSNIIRSDYGVKGRLSWTTTGTNLLYADGYLFTVLTPFGVGYVLKNGEEYDNSGTIIWFLGYGQTKVTNFKPTKDYIYDLSSGGGSGGGGVIV